MRAERRASQASRSVEAGATAGLRLGAVALGLVASIAVSRALGPGGRGVYAVAAALGGIAAVLGAAGVQRSLQYERSHGRGTADLTGAALLAGGATGGAGALAVGLLAWAVPAVRGPASLSLVALALCGAPAVVVCTHLSTLLALADRPASAAAVSLRTTALQSSLLVAAALLALLTPAAVVLIGVLAALAGVPLLLRRLPPRQPAGGVPRHVTAALLRRGLRYQAGHVAAHLLLRVDIVLVAALRGAGEAGVYSLAVALAEPIVIVTSSAAQAGWGAQARGEGGDAYTARLARTTLTLAALLALPIALLSPALVPRVFGGGFLGSVPALWALLPGVLLLASREPLEMAVSRRDRPAVTTSLTLAALALNVALNVALVPRWGATGAAAASSAAYGMQFAGASAWFLRTAHLPAASMRPRTGDLLQPLRAAARALFPHRTGAR